MERPLRIKAQQADDLLTLDLHGELDIATVPQVRDAVAQHADGQAAIVLDLHELAFIDSSGIRLLLELNARQTDPPLYFHNPSEAVSRLLGLTGTDGMLRWHRP